MAAQGGLGVECEAGPAEHAPCRAQRATIPSNTDRSGDGEFGHFRGGRRKGEELVVVSHEVVHAARSSFFMGVSAPHPACGRLRL